MTKLSSTFSTKDLLHAYIAYQEILQAALVFACTGKNVNNALCSEHGTCHQLYVRDVSRTLMNTLAKLHTQTNSIVFPVKGGNYWRTDGLTKWIGTYGENRRKYLADCIETLRVELNRRGYSF